MRRGMIRRHREIIHSFASARWVSFEQWVWLKLDGRSVAAVSVMASLSSGRGKKASISKRHLRL